MDLRDKLRNVQKPLETLILTVSGPSGSGKSYALELIKFLTGPKGFDYHNFRLDEATTPTHFVDEMKRALRGETDLEKGAGKRDEDAAKWYRYVCQNFVQELVGQRTNDGRPCWIIVDDANHLDESLDVPVMLAQLALAVFHEGREKIRMVVLGCQKRLEQNMDTRDSREIRRRVKSAELAYLSESDVRQFLVKLLEDARNNQFGPLGDDLPNFDDADQWVTQVMTIANGPDPLSEEERPEDFTYRLCTALEDIVDGIFRK